MFEYLSQCLREEDEYHGASVVYMGDQDEQGQDPTAYEMDAKTVEDMGGMMTVEGVENQELIRDFYKVDANKGKLFVPPNDAIMKKRLVVAVLPASKRTLKFVLENNPTMLELYKFAETLDDADKKQAIQEWALHGCQAKKGDKAKRPCSILAHKFEPVEEPSKELQQVLKARLDHTIGTAAPIVTPLPTAPRPLATDPTVVAERQVLNTSLELARNMKKLLKNPKANNKWSKMQRGRLAGWSGKDSFDKCAPALKKLEQYIGRDGEAAQFIKEEMDRTAEEHGLRIHGVVITKKVAKFLTSTEPSHDNSGRPSGRSAHKGLNHTHFLPWSTDKRNERIESEEAQEDPKVSRTPKESRENAAAGARRTPADYVDLSSATEAYYCFLLAFFPDADITNDYRMMHDLLQNMREDKDVVETQTYMTISWLMLDNDAQYWSVRTNADDLYDQRNLPKSTLQFIMPGLKINKSLPIPTGISNKWRAKPATKKREREQVHEHEDRTLDTDTHPLIRDLMDPIFEQHACIPLNNILEEAGLTRERLPFLYKYGRTNMCYHGILGYCSKKERGLCKLEHPSPDEVDTPGFVQELVSKLKPGVDKILNNGLPFQVDDAKSKRQKFGY